MKTITFFNNKGGVGKTTLVYHVAWMCAELGLRVLAVDLDPQANLTTMFLDEKTLEMIWPEDGHHQSILSCISPIIDGLGDIADTPLQQVQPRIHLLPGDLGLSQFEDKLSDCWPRCLGGDKSAFRVITAFHRIIQCASESINADIILMDVGPNLGAINRASLIAADYVVIPLSPSLITLQDLRNLGPTLHTWRENWHKRLLAKPSDMGIPMPAGDMKPTGYVVMLHVERKSQQVKAYQRWISKIPKVYANDVLQDTQYADDPDKDPNRIGLIKNYQSLMQLAEDARKPTFKLAPADGAIGAYAVAVTKSYLEFKNITEQIILRIGV
ncbi:MAG: ParA family protein [Armatimonadota bacterium]